VVFAPDGMTLAATGSHHIGLWDVATGKVIRRWRARGDIEASCLAFSPDGKTLASWCREDCAIHLWDAATGKDLHPADGPSVGVCWLAQRRKRNPLPALRVCCSPCS